MRLENDKFVTNGSTTFKPDEQGTITCDINYVPAYTTTTCQTDSYWSHQPSCIEVICTVPTLSNGQYYENQNAVSGGTALVYQSVITPFCSIGFSSIPDTPRTCQIDGQWSGQPSICAPIVCDGLPLAFENGIYNVRETVSYAYNDTITPKCDAGFFLYQGVEHRCSGVNFWSGETPVCSSITCKSPSAFSNSYYNGSQTSYIFKSVLVPACELGYYITTNVQSRTCVGQDTWSGANSVCQIVQCAEPRAVENGHLNSDNKPYEYKTIITLACNDGYDADDGITHASCLENGTWSRFPLRCVQIMCTDTDSVRHTAIDKYTLLAIGNIAEVSNNTSFFHLTNGSVQVKCTTERKLAWIQQPDFGLGIHTTLI